MQLRSIDRAYKYDPGPCINSAVPTSARWYRLRAVLRPILDTPWRAPCRATERLRVKGQNQTRKIGNYEQSHKSVMLKERFGAHCSF